MGSRAFLPTEERVGAGAAVTGRLQSANVCLSVDVQLVPSLAGTARRDGHTGHDHFLHCGGDPGVATLESSPYSIVIANGGGDNCLMLIGLSTSDIASTTRCWGLHRIDIHRHCHFRHPTRCAAMSALRNILSE